MGATSGYGQYCPITRAVEVLGERWSVLIVRDLLCGATRFNELSRGNPRLSRTLLSKRLRQLELALFDIQPVGNVPPHSHCSQWGVVFEGEMSLTIGGNTKIYRKGDWYFIPEGVEHSATFLSRVQVMDIFDAPDRYSPKQS